MKLKAFALFLLLPILALGQDAGWQTGKLIKLTKTKQVDDVPRTHRAPGRQIEEIDWTMQVEAGGLVYYAEIDADTPPPLTENKDIQWMVVKDKFHYKDDNGKEHKAKLLKKRAEDAPPTDAAGPASAK